ncbi:MAG: hypothetical protein KBA30_03265 [Clostridia bacterium]|nr:hypothetical protein [Clostridia bacterium]
METKRQTLTLDPNHDGLPPVSRRLFLGNTFRAPRISRYGYDFTGWHADAGCTRPLTDAQILAHSGALYAGWIPWDERTREATDEFLQETREAKYITSRAPLYEPDTFYAYYPKAIRLLFQVEAAAEPVDEDVLRTVRETRELRAKLKLKVPDPEQAVWYIWGDRMPEAADADRYDFYGQFDYPGFRPFLLPYLLPDQSTVKGNILVVAGGGFAQRYNQNEGYPIAEAFNRMGYNAFILQRRVAPWEPIDSSLDLQRSVRYLRHHAARLGIAAVDRIAPVGFSGGGATIIGMVERCYGAITPEAIHPGYVPDAIDAIDSDCAAAMIVYGAFGTFQHGNPRVPSLFLVVGAKDELAFRGTLDFTASLGDDIVTELHVFADAKHGFGTGTGLGAQHPMPITAGADEWLHLADRFLEVEFGLKPRTTPYTGK